MHGRSHGAGTGGGFQFKYAKSLNMHTVHVFLVWRLILIVVCQHHKSTFMLSYPQDQHNVDIAIAISTAIISIIIIYFQYMQFSCMHISYVAT